MGERRIAEEVVEAVGGASNVIASNMCMTRLRMTLCDARLVSKESLTEIKGVLGSVSRGERGLEVVLGPSLAKRVYGEFCDIVGSRAEKDPTLERPTGNMRVVVSPARHHSYRAQADANARRGVLEGEDDDAVMALTELLDKGGSPQADDRESRLGDKAAVTVPSPGGATERSLLVVNGPNINMVGIREPGIYGTQTYADIVALCESAASEHGFSSCDVYQSNHEGDLVDRIQAAYGNVDAIAINPGAYTHTSVAILDALKAVSIPAIEVHISKIESREEFRQVSYVRHYCFETVTGLGIEGYRKAIADLAAHLDESSPAR